ncbi:MAG TPA: thiamine pyrophosphate-dependent enzyme, partial [Roseiflexaceae bacterium]|nr:thiamine pyrophosphate-dependent enzyme [Roseiflexaceae bacterium]
SIQEDQKLIVTLFDNSGYKSIGSLSRSLGQTGFGTRYAYPQNGVLPDDGADEVGELPVDLAANAESLGAHVIRCQTYDDFVKALRAAKSATRTTVIYIRNDRLEGVPGYESWWDVPVAEVSASAGVAEKRAEWQEMRTKERHFL